MLVVIRYVILIVIKPLQACNSQRLFSSGQCLDKWHYFQGHCYRVFDVHLREWHAARAMYKYEAGDLVKIDSAEEQDFLITIFPEWNNVWIGMSRGRDKKFYWRWGEKPTYTNWGRGEPNDASVLEDCLEMRRDGKWNDLQCRRRLYGLCEKK